MATTLTSTAARWLADRHGVATVAELRALGLGRKAVERLCTLGVLRRAARGVYVLTAVRQTLEHRCRLVCCLHGGGFVTGPTAAMLGGLRRQPPHSSLHFSVRHGVHLHHVHASGSARRASCGPVTVARVRMASSSHRGRGWRSTSPPTWRRWITDPSSTNFATGDW